MIAQVSLAPIILATVVFFGLSLAIMTAVFRRASRRANKELRSAQPPSLPFRRKIVKEEAKSLDYRRLFDFLRNLTDDEVLKAISDEMPLKIAMILRFLSFDQRTRILQSLSPKSRLEIESLTASVERIPSDEFIRIADRVRRKLSRPTDADTNMDEESFWTETLQKSPEKNAILAALRKTRPDLKTLTDRFSVRIDDIPTLPRFLIEDALRNMTDHEIALALSACPRHVVDHLIREISAQRRARILERVRALGTLPKSVTGPAVQSLLGQFQNTT